MNGPLTPAELLQHVQSIIDLAETRKKTVQRPLFRSYLDRDDRDMVDMHVRAINWLRPHVDSLLERMKAGEVFAENAREMGPVDALDIAIGGIDLFLEELEDY